MCIVLNLWLQGSSLKEAGGQFMLKVESCWLISHSNEKLTFLEYFFLVQSNNVHKHFPQLSNCYL